ncbi:hypothetical protein [uncultured Aquimarina sp.]|uniref:hypothetical protein n=1 Tax=uncultured Aquimarina sp. TaxID=575652 RepID=UPI00261DCD44|nr:hypothetical protein [uncultured Aquimarina sp.]
MKNLRNLLFRAMTICLIITISSCEKKDIEQGNLSLLEDNKLNKIEKYDEYTIEKPEKDGVHLVGKNERTGSVLSIRIRRGKVIGFQILKKDQNLTIFDKLVIPTSQNLPPWKPISCPDGWDGKLICYTNKDGIPVSYFRCTPTSFTIGLEPKW